MAQQVMHWEKRSMFLAGNGLPDRGALVWATPGEPKGHHYLVKTFWPQIPEEEYELGFEPSTEIEPVWAVVEHLTGPCQFYFQIRNHRACFGLGALNGEDGHPVNQRQWREAWHRDSSEASTIPLTICRAALKAMSPDKSPDIFQAVT